MVNDKQSNKPAWERLEQAGYTTFGAHCAYDPHLKQWRVVMMAGKPDGTYAIMLAPDVFQTEQEARLNALVVHQAFTKKGKKHG